MIDGRPRGLRQAAHDRAAALERWRADPAAFIEQYLVVETEDDRPFQLLDVERSFLKHMFQFDADGRLKYPELIYAAIKKSGKTTFAAIILIVTVLLFGGRRAEGYCVANDFEQAQGRVFETCRRIVEDSPLLRREAKVSADRITFTATGATITALASDYASAAGGHPCIAVFDELWGYASERSRRLWDELVPVPTRRISCRMVVSHAGFEGEGELLHELYKRGAVLPEVGADLHAGDGLLMFWCHRPVGPWQDERWFALMRRSLRPNQFLRMCENRFVTTESSFVDIGWWDACVDSNATPVVTDPDMPVWCAVDASVKHDSTAIVACAWDKEARKVRLVFDRTFQPSPEEPLDFEATVEQTVKELCRRFAVRAVRYDPYQMAAVAQRLQAAGVPMREFPQTVSNLTEIGSGLFELIKGRGIVVYPDAGMRLAISRAIAVETARGWRITKEKQSHKIDVLVALAMAAHAAVHQARIPEPKIVMPIMFGTPRYIPGQTASQGEVVVFAPVPASESTDAQPAAETVPPSPSPPCTAEERAANVAAINATRPPPEYLADFQRQNEPWRPWVGWLQSRSGY